MNSDRWRELKRKLTDESDLSEIWLYYMDHFADYPKFTNMGSRVTDPYLDAVTLSICQHLENTKTGLLAVSADVFDSGMMQYSRFSKPIELPQPPDLHAPGWAVSAAVCGFA